MKRFAFVLGLSFLGLPAHADITHKIQSSVQLTVDGAGSIANRVPSSLAVSGSNVTLDTVPAMGTLTPAALLVTLLALSASLMLLTAFRTQKASLKETQLPQQPQSSGE